MSIENLTIEDLEKEIERRKAAETDVIRHQLEDARKLVRELEAKLGVSQKPLKAVPVLKGKDRLTAGEKADKILTALDSRDFTSSSLVASLVGFDGIALREALSSLVTEGKLVREGKARGTKYKLA